MKHLILIVTVITAVGAASARTGTGKGAPDKVVRKLEQSLLKGEPNTERVGETLSGYLEQHRSREATVPLEDGSCYKFVAAGAPDAANLSLDLTIGGKEVARDRISGKRPVMRWCAAESRNAVVRVSMYDGEGVFVLLVLREKKGTGAAPKVGGDGSDFIATRVRQLHAQFAKDQKAHSPFFQGNLAAGEAFDTTVRLEAGRCYTVLASGSPTVRDLNIAVRDPVGATVAEDKTHNSYPVIDSGLCPSAGGAYTLTVKMAQGAGPFGVQVFLR
jgi:hypothetical protein